MKLRTKVILFFGIFLLSIIFIVASYAQYVVGGTYKSQTTNDLRIFAEQSEGAYYTFLKNMKGRALDWSGDSGLQRIVVSLLKTKEGSLERSRLAKEFSDYIVGKKMPYDKTVFLVDLLDKDGIVVASTNEMRIGTNEKEEEMLHNVSHFSKTIVSGFGQAFVKSIVFEEDETTEPMVHATTRMFAQNTQKEFVALDAVLMLHFLNIQGIADVLSGEGQIKEGAQTGKALTSSYSTSEIYLVNSEKIMVTPSRFVKDVKSHQIVDTLPVRECLENSNEFLGEYDDYRGVRVLGASMCLRSDGLVLLVEISKDEIFAPLSALTQITFLGGGILLIFGLLVVFLFIELPLKRIDQVVYALERLIKGDLSAKAVVNTKDETGRLASMFNTMVESIRKSQMELEESKKEVEKKARVLEEDIVGHEKQEKFLEESKKATLNLLEDSWKAKERLEEEGSKLQTILSSIEDGLVLIDAEYRIALVNEKVLSIFEMTRDSLIGQDMRTIIKITKNKVDLEPAQWPTEEVFLTKSPLVTTIEDNFAISTTSRKSPLPVALSIAPIAGRFSGLVVVVRDITQDRELDEAKNGFISVASHQLRTPLTSIRWYSEMLLSEDVGTLNDSQKDFMKEIHSGAERLYQTVDLLLGISRVESGKLKSDRTPIDLGMFTGEITKELSSQMDEKNLTLSVIPPDRAPVVVWLDSLILRQVLLNLVSNAIRYTNEHGNIEIKWWVNEDGREAVYMVHDNGIGIPEREQPRIFSKFFRAENARAQVPDGSGLGLALVKNLVESWGGKVWFDTAPGQGTTFFFTVPFTTQVADLSEHAKMSEMK